MMQSTRKWLATPMLAVALVALMVLCAPIAWSAGGDAHALDAAEASGDVPVVWDGSVDTAWYDQSSSSFTLNTPAQLAGLAAIVNGDAEGIPADSFKGKTVSLGADILLNETASTQAGDASQHTWTPIGKMPMNGVNPDGAEGPMPHYVDNIHFDGTFDGCGHVIRNLYIYDNQEGSYGGVQALFANVGGSATIRNVGIDGGYVYGRVAAGLVADSHVTAEDLSAGIVPHIIGCFNTAKVVCNGSSTRGGGGIFGGEEQYRAASSEGEANYHGAAYIANCYNAGEITRASTSNSSIGGIAGTGSVQIYGCYNRGSVTATSSYCGAIAGNLIGAGYTIGQGKGPREGAACVLDSYAVEGTVQADDNGMVKLYNLFDASHYKDGHGEANPAIVQGDRIAFKSAEWFASDESEDALSQSYDMQGSWPVLYWQVGAEQWDLKAYDDYDYEQYEIRDMGRYAYTGTPLCPVPDIVYYRDGGFDDSSLVHLHEGSDFAVSYADNDKIGKATVTVTGVGRFFGARNASFQIIDGDLGNASVSPILAQWWYGEEVHPDVKVIAANGDTLVADRDYKLSYVDCDPTSWVDGKSTGLVIVEPMDGGGFTGKLEASFTILRASTSLQGAGTEDDPKLISSKEDLQFLAWKTHAGSEIAEYGTYCYKLTADIDATSSDDTYATDRPCDPLFTSHGTSDYDFSHGFAGTFDGAGHTITLGLTEDGVSFDLHPALALMVYTKSGASPVVKNLTVDGSVACPHGAAAGFLVMGQSGHITFDACRNNAAIAGDAYYSGGAAGFVAQVSVGDKALDGVTMMQCVNAGTVTSAQSRAAGFVSALGGQSNAFENCLNEATVTSGKENGASGFVAVTLGAASSGAASSTTSFERCSNSGDVKVSTTGDAGAFVGVCTNPIKQLSLDRCSNAGSISAAGSSCSAGGLVGRLSNSISVSNCYSVATVSTTDAYSNAPGGFIGYVSGGSFEQISLNLSNAYVSGSFTGPSSTPGSIIGTLWNHAALTYDHVYFDKSLSENAIGYNIADRFPSLAGAPVITGQAVGCETSYMKSATFVSSDLSLAFGEDESGVNDGFPVLLVQDRVDERKITDCQVSIDSVWQYTGSAIRPEVKVMALRGSMLEEGVDYVVFYSAHGTKGRAVIRGIGSWAGQTESEFTVLPCSLADCTISQMEEKSYADFAGGEATQSITVTNPAGGVMREGVDYEVSYAENASIGTAYVLIQGLEPYYDSSAMRTFTIAPGDLSTVRIEDVADHYPIDRGGELFVYETLVANDGYELSRSNVSSDQGDYIRLFYDANGELVTRANGSAAYSITKAGTYTVKFLGEGVDSSGVSWTNGHWTGVAEATFTYGNIMAEDANVSLSQSTFGYTGNPIAVKPQVVNADGYSLDEGEDYEVSFLYGTSGSPVSEVVDAGQYRVVVTGCGDWMGSVEIPFEVIPAEYCLEDATVEGIESTYMDVDGTAAPRPTAVRIGDKALSPSDYSVSYEDASGRAIDAPHGAGSYFVVLTGCAPYAGEKRIPFTVETPFVSVYVQVGANGQPKLAHAFTKDECVGLKSAGDPVSALYCDKSGSNWRVATAKDYVTLDDLLAAADVQDWAAGASVRYGGDSSQGKSATVVSYEDAHRMMFYPATTATSTDVLGGVQVPFVLSLTDSSCSIGDGGSSTAYEAAAFNVSNAHSENAPRVITGVLQSDYADAANRSSAMMGARLWNKLDKLVVVLPDGPHEPGGEDDPAPANEEVKCQNVFRLYNPNSGEHFYTLSSSERDTLARVGWSYEGIGWKAPMETGDPVYRLYNPNSGDHHYTMSNSERDNLVSLGWNDEGIGWYSDKGEGQALLRLYNPNAQTGSHHYTVSAEERDSLVKAGWSYEGIGWYGAK